MAVETSVEPMLPTAPDVEGQTPYEVGYDDALAERPFTTRTIPTKHRGAYARGYARGSVRRAQESA